MPPTQRVNARPRACGRCERLSRYVSQMTRELLDAQESCQTSPSRPRAVLAAATAWKRARRLFDEHLLEHGSCAPQNPSAKPTENKTFTVSATLNRFVSAIRFWRSYNPKATLSRV